jgi:thiamine-monophosphate kinase
MLEDRSTALTPVSQLGEFGLIERLTQPFKKGPGVALGPGDDAALIDFGPGYQQVVTTDMLLEGVHFDLTYVPLQHLGYKAIAVNVSDLAAMNAEPVAVTVSVAMSNRFTIEAMDVLYEGILVACEKFGVTLVGGDLSSSRQGLVISVTAIGKVKRSEVVLRSGGKAGDLVCVTGDLGAAYAGLLVLEREKAAYAKNPNLQPDLSDYDYVMGRQLRPNPRLDIIQALRDAGVKPHAMMDISDGLASEIHHICRQSKCGANIFASKLPIDVQTGNVAEEFQISPTTFAMNGGEDYELIFTVPLSDFEKVRGIPEVTIVGKLTEDPGVVQLVLEAGQVVDIEAQGWNHFSQTPAADPS